MFLLIDLNCVPLFNTTRQTVLPQVAMSKKATPLRYTCSATAFIFPIIINEIYIYIPQ